MISKKVYFKPAIKKAVLLEGVPGIGNVGKIAIDFLVDTLKAKKMVSLKSTGFPPSVYVNEKNLVEAPECSIYYVKGKKFDILLLAGDVQPVDEEHSFELAYEVLNIAKENKVDFIYCVGGIGLRQIPKSPRLFATSTDQKIIEEMEKKGFETKLYGYVGPIVGLAGLLTGFSKDYGIKSACILAETFGHPMYLGVKGARQVIMFFKKELGLNINLKELDKEIIEIEKEIKKIKSIEPKAKPISYIG